MPKGERFSESSGADHFRDAPGKISLSSPWLLSL